MGVRFPSVQSNTFLGPLPANATETVIAVTPPLTLPLDGAVVLISWSLNILAGTGTTGFQFHVRRGTTTAGTDVSGGGPTQTTAAGQNNMVTQTLFDTPGAVAGQQYALTIIQTGATAAGANGPVFITAFAL